MKKRMLITSTDLMMIQFLVPHVVNLAENGYEVEIACSEVGGRMDEVRENGGSILVNQMEEMLGIPVIPISAAKNEKLCDRDI